MMPQQYCLRWKHHHTNVQNMFAQLLEKERFCDVTLYCSPSFATQVSDKDTVDPQHIRGVSLRAHRVVLAACSELLGALLGAHDAQGEPVLVIDGAEPKHLKALLDYMYTGEMNVHHSQLASLLKTAEELRIKGLTDIRWNNKDEPPDCDSGVVTTVATNEKKSEPKMIVKAPEPKPVLPKHTPPKQPSPKQPSPKHVSPKHTPPKLPSPKHTLPKLPSPKHASPKAPSPRLEPELRTVKMEVDIGSSEVKEKLNINGGPPPLIKLPTKEKCSPLKREPSDSDTPSPKRLRLTSITEHTDDESVSHSISEKDAEWQHGNLDITAERVVSWGSAGGGGSAGGSWSREPSDDEWADAPTDIGSFLHTRLRVDGDNSADDESNDSTGEAPSVVSAAASSTSVNDRLDVKLDMAHTFSQKAKNQERTEQRHAPRGGREGKCKVAPSKYGPVDPRFPDVVKLSDYLQHGRRPQFWEERYVKRVMEAVRVKELEMKQAAEILGVSYGTLYGRYRDVYGCINRPYRTARDFWAAKGPSEVLERLQRGEISVEAASLALGVGVSNLAAYMAADFNHPDKEFEPIPIEMDPSLSVRRMYNPGPGATSQKVRKPQTVDKTSPKKVVGGTDEESIPATIISTSDTKQTPVVTTVPASGKWPTIRVASLDTLRGGDTLAPPLPSAVSPPAPAPSPSPSPSPAPVPSPASPSALMRTRPDLTIVAAKKTDKRGEET